MARIKVSQMTNANGISNDDILYIVKKNASRSGYDSRQTTVGEFKRDIEEDLIESLSDRIVEKIMDSPLIDEIQRSYRNELLDYEASFKIDFSGTAISNSIVLPMDAWVRPVNTLYLTDVPDYMSSSNSTGLRPILLQGQTEQGVYLKAGTRFLVKNIQTSGASSTISKGSAYIVPLINGMVDMESSNALCANEKMTLLQLSNKIEEWGRASKLVTPTPNSNIRYGIYVANGTCPATEYTWASRRWYNQVENGNTLVPGKWMHISKFASTSDPDEWSLAAQNATPKYFAIYCPFVVSDKNTSQFQMTITWWEQISKTSKQMRYWKYTAEKTGLSTGSNGGGAYQKGWAISKMNNVIDNSYPLTLVNLPLFNVVAFDLRQQS